VARSYEHGNETLDSTNAEQDCVVLWRYRDRYNVTLRCWCVSDTRNITNLVLCAREHTYFSGRIYEVTVTTWNKVRVSNY
jgi:hypothetical protein